MTLRIGLDLDGVVYDFVAAHRDYLTAESDHDVDVLELLPEPTSWSVWDCWPISRETWQRTFDEGVACGAIFTGGHRYAYPGAVEAVQGLAWVGHDIHVVTHRPARAVAATAEWLADVNLPHTSLTFAADKSTVPVDVMIEDNVDNALAVVNAGGRAILFDRPWNRTWKFDGQVADVDEHADVKSTRIIRCHTWEDVIDVVKALDVVVAGEDEDEAIVDTYASSAAFDVVGPQPESVSFVEQVTALADEYLDPIGDPYVDDDGTIGPRPLFGGEVRVTSATGGEKGSKPARFDMIPPDVLWELATHYGIGENKYPSDPETGQANWQRGYAWSLSSAALMRHLFAWLGGEDVDPETGSSHLIPVMWHAAALRWFQLHDVGTDDIAGRRTVAA